jgi:hypothetical protein
MQLFRVPCHAVFRVGVTSRMDDMVQGVVGSGPGGCGSGAG